MHRSRQWIILTLLGLVGLGPMGSGELLAQTVEGVTMKGGTVGIDGVFRVDVTVQDFDEDPALEVAVFLVALEKDNDGNVTDTLIVESGWDADVRGKERLAQHASEFGGGTAAAFLDGAFGTSSSIAPFTVGASPAIINEATTTGATIDAPVRGSSYADAPRADNPFAAFRTADRGTDRNDIPAEGDTPTPEADRKWVGDADSLFITGTGVDDGKIAEGKHKNIAVDTRYLIRWYSTVNEIMGEHDEVYAAAVVRDGTAYSSIVLSDNSMKIDGDRPVQGNYLHFSRPFKEDGFGFKMDADEPDASATDGSDGDRDGISALVGRTDGDFHAVDFAGLGYAKELKGADLRYATGFTASEV